MAKRDISALLKTKAMARAQEMQTTQYAIKSGQTKSAGRPSDGEPRKCCSINLRESSHQKVKLYAVKNGTTISALIEEWIAEHCVD